MITFAKHTHEHSKMEKVGFYLSVACAIHCIATPVLVTLLPFLGSSFVGNHDWEIWFIGGSLVLAGVILMNDYFKHKNLIPITLLFGTVLIKILEINWLGHQYEFLTGSLGAFFIALAYFLNWRYKDRVCGC
jgi:phosphoglycerol transferase MdoB-like AlkP superfamily enzyme